MTYNSCPACGQPVCSDCGHHHGQVGAQQRVSASNVVPSAVVPKALASAVPAVVGQGNRIQKSQPDLGSWDVHMPPGWRGSQINYWANALIVNHTWQGAPSVEQASEWIRTFWPDPLTMVRWMLKTSDTMYLTNSVAWSYASPGDGAIGVTLAWLYAKWADTGKSPQQLMD